MISETLLFAINAISSLKNSEALKILEACPGEKDFLALDLYGLEWLLGRKVRHFKSRELLDRASETLDETRARGIHWTWSLADSYPNILKQIYDPPFLLFWKGSLPPENKDALAVVGTRKPDLEADRAAFALGLDAALEGIPLISGLALGIDGSAHKGAVAGKGPTWAVLATGCDRVYPGSHRKLALEILEHGGGLVSEFPVGTVPARYNFPKRNRIISGLSKSVVIVQAPESSGALYTADFALDQGRDVYVHERGLSGNRSRGSARLAEEGAPLVRCLKDIIAPTHVSEHGMQESYGIQGGTVYEAAESAARHLRREMAGKTAFYRGRVQYL